MLGAGAGVLPVKGSKAFLLATLGNEAALDNVCTAAGDGGVALTISRAGSTALDTNACRQITTHKLKESPGQKFKHVWTCSAC